MLKGRGKTVVQEFLDQYSGDITDIVQTLKDFYAWLYDQKLITWVRTFWWTFLKRSGNE